MVGVTAVHGIGVAEAAVRRAYEVALGDSSLWPDERRRRRFAEVGFHFTEDSESVRQVFLTALNSIQYRGYAAYAKRENSTAMTEKLTAMYGTLLSSVAARYREFDLSVVFEQNSSMDALYGPIWSTLKRRVHGIGSSRAYRGAKNAPCLAMTDYLLGVTQTHLSGKAQPFQRNRFVSLGRNLAYLIDFDDDRHLGGRKHPIV
jgi:hypothetical protein